MVAFSKLEPRLQGRPGPSGCIMTRIRRDFSSRYPFSDAVISMIEFLLVLLVIQCANAAKRAIERRRDVFRYVAD